jgi:hypothetical protein
MQSVTRAIRPLLRGATTLEREGACDEEKRRGDLTRINRSVG